MVAEPVDGVDLKDRSTAELIKKLSGQLGTLVHEEIELAKAEMKPKAKAAGLGAGLLGGAGVIGLLGAGALVAAAIAGISVALPVWLSALIVGAALVVFAGLLALAGRASVSAATPPVPEVAMETSKEDVEWLKARTRSARQ
jgi:hypothetical protein